MRPLQTTPSPTPPPAPQPAPPSMPDEIFKKSRD